jgi:hypothetical protein
MDYIAILIVSQTILVPILGLQLLGIRKERQRNLNIMKNALRVIGRRR